MLNNVSIIRPILIILLVFYHAFAIFSGAWTPLEDYPEIKTYWWFDKLSYAFMLEMFVFISGCVLGFQVRTKGEDKLSAKNIFWGKLLRLIVPSIVFSILYILMFGGNIHFSWQILYDILNGAGHMWFLPMLYWCFVVIWIIEEMNVNHWFTLVFFLLCSICSYVPLPLRLSYTMYYMFFFYCGYIICRKDVNVERFYSVRTIITLFTLFVILFPTLTLLCKLQIEGGYLTKAVFAVIRKGAKILYSGCGIAMLFVLVGWIDKKRQPPPLSGLLKSEHCA